MCRNVSRWKYTELVAFLSVSSLMLQILILYRSSCVVTRTQRVVPVLPPTHYLEDGNQTQTAANRVDTEMKATSPATLMPLLYPNRRRFLTIGVPTIKRKDEDYVIKMLDSMFNRTSSNDLQEIIFVVFLADFDEDWKSNITAKMKERYKAVVDMGSLLIIQAPRTLYSNLKVTKLTYGASEKRVYWRAKQNYDYAYLMKYSWNISDYYMQMEDDVLAVDGYYGIIKDFIANQTSGWVCLEFSELGFIGKLYNSSDIPRLADMLLLFSVEQPVDYTYLYFNTLMMQSWRIIKKPTLFQHIGYHSSFAENIQPLQDRYFDFKPKRFKGDNPPAKVITSMTVNSDFLPSLPYSSQPGYFWSSSAGKEGDTFTVAFDQPQSLDRVIIETGSETHPGDIVENAVLRVSPLRLQQSTADNECVGFLELAPFKNGKLNFTDFQSSMGQFKTGCLQILITKSQVPWVIVQEIAVFVKK